MRRILCGLAALTLSVTLAGCGGSDGGPEATPSTSGSPSASESASAEPTEEPSETVAPIEGVTRGVEGVSATVPKDWKKTQYIGQVVFYEKRTSDSYQMITLGALPWYSTKPSLGEVIAFSKDRVGFVGKVQRLEDLTGPGSTPMFHIRGTTDLGRTADVIGGANATHKFEVEVTSDLPADEHEALVESVIPTIGFPR